MNQENTEPYLIGVASAAATLCVSPRHVYDLAAPAGPIPCYRIGRRILFNRNDLFSYLESCRYTATKKEVISSLNSTAALKARGSGLENTFRKLGISPRLTPSTGKNQPVSMR
ncbi:helix-turn-helix domain-containing protein [Herbaspirillum rubrisubalbicans]|uniref:helix-turn-helix domain-containing protein n=1 Tax=Herbaspirillum rubrisubalbicans TaxID=80842 RepID=UPI000DD47A21